MPTPIASPQNAQALKVITDTLKEDVSFLVWMKLAVPICIVLLPATWAWLIVWWRPKLERIPPPPSDVAAEISSLEPMRTLSFGSAMADRPWGVWHTYVIFITSITVLLWCMFNLVEDVFGSMGIIGLLPVIGLYGPGVLGKDDLKQMDWGILLLLGGGAALGDAVQSSGLLNTLGESLLSSFRSAGLSVYWEFMLFNAVMIFVANFISHTVAAITLLGVLAEVGQAVDKGMAFVLGGVICDSGACALPVSSFPNILAYGVKDKNEQAYLKVSDYLVPAFGVEIVVIVTMATLGWLLV